MWRPGIFSDRVADSWFVEISMLIIFGLIATVLMILRYVVPSTILIFYDRWEFSFIESNLDRVAGGNNKLPGKQ